jgi:bacillithiol system protein YtxJ
LPNEDLFVKSTMKKITEISRVDEWIKIKNDPSWKELIILKYSTACPISSVVEGDFEKWISELPGEKKIYGVKINVIESDMLNKKIIEELKVEHQSPQAIWITRDGKVKWYANHYDINLRSLSARLTI